MKEGQYVRLLAGLINQHPDARERERRVREANRELYRAVVSERGSTTRADLALAQAALQGETDK